MAGMLQFEGDKDLSRPPAEVWAKLSDARFLVQCIPGAEAVKAEDAKTATCKLRPGFAFVRSTLDVTLKVLEAVEPAPVRLSLFSKAIGATSDVEAVLTFSPQDGGTRVHWKAEVKSLTGLLKLVP